MPESFRKPRRLHAGDRIAVVAPASPFERDEFDRGVAELRALGFEPVFDESVFARESYVAGSPAVRAAALHRAWSDPTVAAVVAARGGYGSAQVLPLLDARVFRQRAKAFIGYSDNTALLTWLTLDCGLVTFHGPMLEGRLARGAAGYDRDTFARCLLNAEPPGAITHAHLEVVRGGTATGLLVGGTMAPLAASLGTPYAFDPPDGCVLFLDEVGERPYRIDRMFTQLQQAGIIDRAAALVFNELPRCDEATGRPAIRDVVRHLTRHFAGPVLFGLPSGHTDSAMLTLPFGVIASVRADAHPALVIEEAAVV
ncbi:MAG TPA: LD-carboxypeptidase [Vicinamibacterales bacterium]|nr:LD-carboxypeptidase [Vicinamibacterales bacterium]